MTRAFSLLACVALLLIGFKVTFDGDFWSDLAPGLSKYAEQVIKSHPLLVSISDTIHDYSLLDWFRVSLALIGLVNFCCYYKKYQRTNCSVICSCFIVIIIILSVAVQVSSFANESFSLVDSGNNGELLNIPQLFVLFAFAWFVAAILLTFSLIAGFCSVVTWLRNCNWVIREPCVFVLYLIVASQVQPAVLEEVNEMISNQDITGVLYHGSPVLWFMAIIIVICLANYICAPREYLSPEFRAMTNTLPAILPPPSAVPTSGVDSTAANKQPISVRVPKPFSECHENEGTVDSTNTRVTPSGEIWKPPSVVQRLPPEKRTMVEDLLFTFFCRGSSSGYFYTLIAVYMSHAADLLNIAVLVDVSTSPWLFNRLEQLPRTGHFSGCCHRNTVLLLLYKNAKRFNMWSRKALTDGNNKDGRPFISLLRAGDRQLSVTVVNGIYQRGPHYTLEFPIQTACVVDTSNDNSILGVLLRNSMRFFRWSRMALTEGGKHKPSVLTKQQGGVGCRLQAVVPINDCQESLPTATLVFSLPENVLSVPQCYTEQLNVCSGMGEDVATRDRAESCDRDILVISSLRWTEHELNVTVPPDIRNYRPHGRLDQLLNTSNIASLGFDSDLFSVLYRITKRFNVWSRMALTDGKCNSSKTYHLSVRDPIDIHQRCLSVSVQFLPKTEQVCDSLCNSDILRVIYRNTKRFDVWSRRALTDGKNTDTKPWHLTHNYSCLAPCANAAVLTDVWQDTVSVVCSITDHALQELQCSTPVGFGMAQGVRTRDEPQLCNILYISLLNCTEQESRASLPTDIHRHRRDDRFEPLATNSSISLDENDLLHVLLYNARRFEIWSRMALTDGRILEPRPYDFIKGHGGVGRCLNVTVPINDRHESQAFPRAILVNVVTEEDLPLLQSHPGTDTDHESEATLPANIHRHWTGSALQFHPDTASTTESLYDTDILHVLQYNTKRFDMWSRMALTGGKNSEPRSCYSTTEHLLSDNFVYVLSYRVLPVLQSHTESVSVQSKTAVGIERKDKPKSCDIQHISSSNHTNHGARDMELLHVLQCNTKRFDLWSRMALTDGKNKESRPCYSTPEHLLSDKFVYILTCRVLPVLQSQTEGVNVQCRTAVGVERKDKPKPCDIQHISSLHHTKQGARDMELLHVLQYNTKRFDMWPRMALTDGKNSETRPRYLTTEHDCVGRGLHISHTVTDLQESPALFSDNFVYALTFPVLQSNTEYANVRSTTAAGVGRNNKHKLCGIHEVTPSFATTIHHDSSDNGTNTMFATQSYCDMELLDVLQNNTKRYYMWSRMALTDKKERKNNDPRPWCLTNGHGGGEHDVQVFVVIGDRREFQAFQRAILVNVLTENVLPVLQSNTEHISVWSSEARLCGIQNISFLNHTNHEPEEASPANIHHHWTEDALEFLPNTANTTESLYNRDLLQVLQYNTMRFDMWSRMALTDGRNSEPRPWSLTNEHSGVDDGLQVSVAIEDCQESKPVPNDILVTDNILPVLECSTEQVSVCCDMSEGVGTGEEPTACNTMQMSLLHCIDHEPTATLPTEGNLHGTDNKRETLNDERSSLESLYDGDLLRVLHRNTKRFDMWSKMALTDGRNRGLRTCNCLFISCLTDRLVKVTVLTDVHQYWPDDGLATTTCFPSSCCGNNVLCVLCRNTKRFHMWSKMALCSGPSQNALQPGGVDSVETEKDKISSGWLSHITLSKFTPSNRVMTVLGAGLVAVGVIALLKRCSGS